MDVAQLKDWYERYGYLVHRRCLALLGSKADADDALQEVFSRLVRYPPPPELRSPLAWLYTLAARCSIDVGQRRARETPTEDRALQAAQPARGGPTDGDRLAMMGMVLRKLDRTTREIGVLYHLDGLTQDEVAAQTGYSRRTVGKKLALFEALMRQHLSFAGGWR